jgi:hypothetical protein
MMKRPRVHREKHLKFIRSLPCIITGDTCTVEAAHLRMPDPRIDKRPTGMGEKPDDLWVLPLSGEMHRKQHTMSEYEFWYHAGIDPVLYALALFSVSGDHERGCAIVAAAQATAGQIIFGEVA